MIYTVTLNPSIDYIASVENFSAGRINRTNKEIIFPGGKGINVSIVLKNLGLASTALGFISGFTGKELINQVSNLGIENKFLEVKDGLTRINVKLRSNEETEINGMGPIISNEELNAFYSELDELQKGDVLILAGSIPSSLPSTIYRDILARLNNKGVLFVVDATKDLLLNVLEYHPFLIKPNNFELGEMFGISDLKDRDEIIRLAHELQNKGARNVLVSMAKDGAILIDEKGNIFKSKAPEGKVLNSVGAGDSMVAGFLYGYFTKGNFEDAFYWGLCSGSASAFSENLAIKSDVVKLLNEIGRNV